MQMDERLIRRFPVNEDFTFNRNHTYARPSFRFTAANEDATKAAKHESLTAKHELSFPAVETEAAH